MLTPKSVSILAHTTLRIATVCCSIAALAVLPVAGQEIVSGGAGAIGSPIRIGYENPVDGTRLEASLVLPDGPGPHPGVVVLSIAGTDPLVGRLHERGYAVLLPDRRGFAEVEPLLRARYQDLATDVGSALGVLAARPEVADQRLAVIAQAGDAPAAILALADTEVPLALLAPPAFPGVEEFRQEQQSAARRARWAPEALEALDETIDAIVEIATSESPSYVREYRLRNARAAAAVQLPRSASFPSDDRQAHFFGSPFWKDRLSFEPEAELDRLGGPVLVLIGSADADTPLEAYRSAMLRGLQGVEPSTLCVLPGRTRHLFSSVAVELLVSWLESPGPGECPAEGTGGE